MVTKNMRVRQSARLQRKHPATRRAVFSALFLGGFCLLVVFFAYQNLKLNAKRHDLQARAEVLRHSMSDMKYEREELAQETAYSQTQEYQEKVLREQGLYKRGGEEVVTVLAPDDANVNANSEGEKEKRIWWNPFSW